MHRRSFLLARCCLLAGACAVAGPVANAAVTVPAGASLKTGSGTISGSGDVLVSGRLELAAGSLLGVNRFRVDAAGTADLASGQIALSGDWENRGSVIAGSSRVRMIDGGSVGAAILGSTLFANLSIVSSIGKRYLLEAGLTQSVAGLLDLHGTSAAPLQLASTVPGVAANLNLLPSGSQSIDTIGVSDVHATGQHLAPTQTNQGGSGNATGWFAAPYEYVAVPGLSSLGRLLLALSMALLALRARRYFLLRS